MSDLPNKIWASADKKYPFCGTWDEMPNGREQEYIKPPITAEEARTSREWVSFMRKHYMEEKGMYPGELDTIDKALTALAGEG